ncbi:MAG: alpha/beta hydrolase, partial [Intestinibacter sp.]
MKKKKYLKRVGIISVALILVFVIGFFVYVSNYYHAQDYQVGNIAITEEKNYIVYGDSNSKTGFIFYQGGKVEAEAYKPILSKLAEKGICCVLVEMPYNLAVFDSNAAGDIMKDFQKIENWYIGGHSLGGAMASSFAAEHQRDLKGLVLLAAYPTDKLEIPVLSIYGSEDGVLNKEKYKASIDLAENLTEIVIKGGNHAQFGNYGEQSGDGKAAISK